MFNRKTVLGIACGVAAGALWGLVFIAPAIAHDFGPLQLAAGRYVAYGLFAVALIVPSWRRLSSIIGRKEWTAIVWLSILGNTLYYVLLASAVQYGGVAMTSLVIGFLPVAVTIIGSRDRGAVPLSKLAPSLFLSAAGILCIGWQSFGATSSTERSTQLFGLLCAFGALASWTAYAIINSRWLARLDGVSSHEWTLLIGVMTGAQALILIPPAVIYETKSHGLGDWLLFVAVCAGIAILSSIMGNGLWNQASRLLPLTMVGQMILFETLFALLYGFLWESRLPTALEVLAIVLVVASVLSCLAAHTPARENVQAMTLGHE